MSTTDALTITSAPDALTRYYDAKEREESAVLYINDAYLEAVDALEKLEAENAKLRELLARVERARRDLCDAYPDAERLNCEECPAWSACRGDLMDRMRELGVEVDG